MTHRLATLACLVCGHESDDRRVVAVSIARYLEAVEGRSFLSIPRCLDAGACRTRTEAQGDAWPLDDATPAPVAATTPTPALVASSAVDDRWG